MMQFAIRPILFLFFIGFSSNVFAIGGGSTENTTIPLPEKNFQIRVSDTSGQKFDAQRVTIDGKVYLKGEVGKAKASIPFEKIRSIEFSNGGTKKIKAQIQLKDGGKIMLSIPSDIKAYGETSFGKFEIFVADIALAEFL